MRILVMSDCHGRISPVRRALENEPEAVNVFYLGDGARQVYELSKEYSTRKFYIVRGNCDPFCDFPESGVVTLCGKNIFYTHGHRYGVKYDTGTLSVTAKETHADMALFGHTHISCIVYDDGLYLVNPGSVSEGRDGRQSYAVIDIMPSGILPAIKWL